jgi:hypothetical protein
MPWFLIIKVFKVFRTFLFKVFTLTFPFFESSAVLPIYDVGVSFFCYLKSRYFPAFFCFFRRKLSFRRQATLIKFSQVSGNSCMAIAFLICVLRSL